MLQGAALVGVGPLGRGHQHPGSPDLRILHGVLEQQVVQLQRVLVLPDLFGQFPVQLHHLFQRQALGHGLVFFIGMDHGNFLPVFFIFCIIPQAVPECTRGIFQLHAPAASGSQMTARAPRGVFCPKTAFPP